MSKLRSIRLAIELATRQRDALAKTHAQALRNVDFAKSQLTQLATYASDTDGRWMSGSAAAMSAEMVRHHYQFMDRLQQAIAMQNGVIANSASQADTAHKALLQAEFRLSGLGQVRKAREATLDAVHKRREQHETDEFASQRYWRAKAASAQGDIR
jgi:flagellar FliJ protein